MKKMKKITAVCWLMQIPIWIVAGVSFLFGANRPAGIACIWIGVLSLIIWAHGGLEK